MNPSIPARMDRREAIKWMFAAAATVAISPPAAPGAEAAPPAKGYGADPDLLKNYQPGDLWPLTFNESQRRAAAALCAVIIPADQQSPSASDLGVHDFIDEWISAPYPNHRDDRKLIVEGLAWLEAESQRRFDADFASLVSRQRNAICDDICHVPRSKAGFETAALFFKRFRELTAGGFYTTPEGMKDIGYVGNIPLAAYDGPPPEVLAKLGLA